MEEGQTTANANRLWVEFENKYGNLDVASQRGEWIRLIETNVKNLVRTVRENLDAHCNKWYNEKGFQNTCKS